jgi:hypothetical protein
MKVETKAFGVLFWLFRTALLGVGALLGLGCAQLPLGGERAPSYGQEGHVVDLFRGVATLGGAYSLISSEIPRTQEYETWSLFLICNPDWLQRTSIEEFGALYKSIGSFGHVIGPKNLAVAVWFWKVRPIFWLGPDHPLL